MSHSDHQEQGRTTLQETDSQALLSLQEEERGALSQGDVSPVFFPPNPAQDKWLEGKSFHYTHVTMHHPKSP